MLSPKRTRFRKQHRGRMKGISCQGNHICFGRYALQALEPAWITARQIEVRRRAMTRYVCRGGKIWLRIFPDKPITVRPAETCMGSGKGSPEYWISVVKPGRILYEMGGVPEAVAKAAISLAMSKCLYKLNLSGWVCRTKQCIEDEKTMASLFISRQRIFFFPSSFALK